MENFGKVSCIITVGDNFHYLKDAIISLLSQTYSNLEIIIVNDGSKDKTLSIIKRNKNRKIFKKIKVLNHKINKGYGAALKTGIRKHECSKKQEFFI